MSIHKIIIGWKCFYCHNKKYHFFHNINGYELVICNKCKILQTNVSSIMIKKINKKRYNDIYLSNYENIIFKYLTKFFIEKIKIIDKCVKGGNLLDYGCSTGSFIDLINRVSRYKWNLYGLDINSKSINKALQKIKANYHMGILKKNLYKNNYFDVISCFDVLEHDMNLQNSLKIINSILKPGGILLIQVPNYESVMCKLAGNDWDWWCLPDHIFHFSYESLKNILLKNNFVIRKTISWVSFYDFAINIKGHIKKNLPKYLFINQIIAKISKIPLFILWIILVVLQKWNRSGGLLFILATKKS